MGSINNTNGCIELVLMLMMVTPSLSVECPNKCRCSATTIQCREAGLKEIPKDIPLTAVYIYLSNNPLSNISRSFFLQFPKLDTLLLNNVSLNGPIFLPNSLRHFGYSFNFITVESLKMMLRGKLDSMKTLELQGINLPIEDIFPILPKGIENLILNGNRLASLKRDSFKCCKNLVQFHCESCSLKFVEPNAFNHVKEISRISLSNNKLVDLPDRIFAGLRNLSMLELRGNRMEYFNARRLGLKTLQTLRLGYNRIEKLDLHNCRVTDLGLEHNRIRRLDAKFLGRQPFIDNINMGRNRIKEISQRAFENVTYIVTLVLHGNNIEYLPGNLLENTLVSKLFLHNNSLSNVDKFILGMRMMPSILTLYSNKKMNHLNTSVFHGINEHSKIFISCNTLNIIKLSSKKRISIDCSPLSDHVIQTRLKFLRYDGYECEHQEQAYVFSCHPCPLGFHNSNDGKYWDTRGCDPCPAGSYYQDEVGSTYCKHCPKGQYVSPPHSPGKDASDCQTCPQGTNTSKLAGTRACSCLKGYHRRNRFGACEKCENAGFECVRDYPQLKEGFWMMWNGTGSSNRSCKQEFQSYIRNLETFTDDYDRNTMKFKCHLPNPIKCPYHGSCHGGIDSKCSLGYTGVLCGVCNMGYRSNFNRCVKCPNIYLIILKWVGFIALFILICYIVSDKMDDSHGVTRMVPSNNERKRTVVDIFISSFKILIGFYQTLIGVMNAYSIINWPKNLIVIISMMEYIQFEVIRIPSLRCINANWAIDAIEEFWLSLIVSLAFPVLCLLYYLAKSCYLHYHQTCIVKIKQRKILCGRNCVRIAVLFMFITYPLILTRIMHVLPASCDIICTANRNGVCVHNISFLRSDMSVNCPAMVTHSYTLVAAYCSLIILCGLPLLLWIVLRRSLRKAANGISSRNNRQYVEIVRQDGREENSDAENSEVNHFVDNSISDVLSLGTPPVLKYALRFTYENYEDKFWYWEVIEMVRKLVMTAGAALFLYNTKIGLSLLIIVGIAFAILHAMQKPMKDGFDNFLQMLSVWIVPINLSVGAVIESSVVQTKGRHGNDPDPWKLGVFLIIINSLIITLIVGRFAKLAAEKIAARAV